VGLTKPRLHFKRQGTNPFSLHPNYMRSHLTSLFSRHLQDIEYQLKSKVKCDTHKKKNGITHKVTVITV
jgi:hypothetical protein